MFYLSVALLLLSMGLVLGDALITKSGLSRGFRETNPVLAFVLGKFRMKGLLVTRLIALMLLFVLFLILNSWEWILFSSICLGVMTVVICVGISKLKHEPQRVTLT
jgi:hypothetical protein